MKPSSSTLLSCRDERRRQKVRDQPRNGVDYVEIRNAAQTELSVRLFQPAPETLDHIQAIIEGGRRICDVQVTRLWADSDDPPDCLRVSVDKPGDFSIYTLHLVAVKHGRPTDEPPADFDPRYAKAQFGFKVDCPGDLDCKPDPDCTPEKPTEPEINYLAKDYASFRQIILDRLALIMPDWRERHVPDIGITLVEALAYTGDYLSYYQDAVATEAYLDTARRRISVRRHARLVDYFMHEGCNSRAWVCIELSGKTEWDLPAADVWLVAGFKNDSTVEHHQLTRDEFAKLPQQPAIVFQPLGAKPIIRVYAAHNVLNFYTWGDSLCCLPRGATEATLKYDWKPAEQPIDPVGKPADPASNRKSKSELAARAPVPPATVPLQPGDVLIFEEVIGPKTGNPADADPSHRWAVRLTSVKPGIDPLNGQQIVEIRWAAADALPFSFCLSVRLPVPDCRFIEDISVARGNVILVDQGRPTDEPLGQVLRDSQTGECACEGSPVDMTDVPAPFHPVLKGIPLTFSQPLPAKPSAPASSLLSQDPRAALPQIGLTGLPGICPETDSTDEPKLDAANQPPPNDPSTQWLPKFDLLGSEGGDRDFVVEMDNEGLAHLRFGDGECGHQPDACSIFSSRYRIGNGPAGNVGAETISVIVLPGVVEGITLLSRNPLPAVGGMSPEPLSEVKLFAPGAFRKVMQRAITADDYARLAERDFQSEVQHAGASLQWTGSWYEAQVAVDPRGAEEAAPPLLRSIEHTLQRYRRIGHDLKTVTAHLVPLDIALTVCVLPHFLRGHVEAAVLEVLGTGVLRDGRLGFFHPDNLSFGEGIFVSKLVAVVQAVPGVESVRVTKLQRYADDEQGELAAGVLPLGTLEVAQLDNDSDFPEHGRLILTLGGGR